MSAAFLVDDERHDGLNTQTSKGEYEVMNRDELLSTADDPTEASVEIVTGDLGPDSDELDLEDSVEIVALPPEEPEPSDDDFEDSVEIVARGEVVEAAALTPPPPPVDAGVAKRTGAEGEYLPPRPNLLRQTMRGTIVPASSARAKLEELFRAKRRERLKIQGDGPPAGRPHRPRRYPKPPELVAARKVVLLTRAPEEAGVWVNFRGDTRWMGDPCTSGDRSCTEEGPRCTRARPTVREDYLMGLRDGLSEAIRELRCALAEDEVTLDDLWELVDRLHLRMPE